MKIELENSKKNLRFGEWVLVSTIVLSAISASLGFYFKSGTDKLFNRLGNYLYGGAVAVSILPAGYVLYNIAMIEILETKIKVKINQLIELNNELN